MDRLKNQPLVSVVIPIVPNDNHIADCIEHVKRSSYQNYEFLIINEGKERSYQRNVGIKNAKGKYLLWLDSDMMISPMLIEECVTMMEKGYYVGLYIPERIVTKGWFGKLRNWERQFYTGTLIDVMRFTRLPAPLFDESLHGPEDSDWERKIHGPRGLIINSFDHHDKIGLIGYLRKKAYYAKCLNKYKKNNPGDKVLTFKYRCIQVFIEHGKWKKFISEPHMAIGVIALMFIRAVIFLYITWKYK